MDSKTLADLISIPLFTGIVGYITNWTGVLMLFRPVQFHGFRVPGLRVLFPLLPRRVQVLPLIGYEGRIGWQGIVPSRADKMASISMDKGLAKLGSVSDFYRSSNRTRSPSIWPQSRRARSATSSSRSCSRRTRSSGTTCRR